MRIIQEGTRARAFCETCNAVVDTVFRYRTLHLEKSNVDVEDVLVDVCERCDATCTIAPQSVPRLKEARERKREELMEARVPKHLHDVLDAIAAQFDAPRETFRPALMRFYLQEFATNKQFAQRVKRLSGSKLAAEGKTKRMAVRVRPHAAERASHRAKEIGIGTTGVMKGIIVAAKEDVLDGRARTRRDTLAGIADCL